MTVRQKNRTDIKMKRKLQNNLHHHNNSSALSRLPCFLLLFSCRNGGDKTVKITLDSSSCRNKEAAAKQDLYEAVNADFA